MRTTTTLSIAAAALIAAAPAAAQNTATQATCTDRNGTLFSHAAMRDRQVGFRRSTSASPCGRTEEIVLMDILLQSL